MKKCKCKKCKKCKKLKLVDKAINLIPHYRPKPDRIADKMDRFAKKLYPAKSKK